MRQGSSSPPSPTLLTRADFGGRSLQAGQRAIAPAPAREFRTNCSAWRTNCVRERDLTGEQELSPRENCGPSPARGRGKKERSVDIEVLSVPAHESQPGFHLGDLRATDRHAMRARAVELDHGAIALLADETDMGDRHDVAAMHPEEQAGVELGFCFGDRPGAHPLTDAVMHPGVMRIGPDAADFRCIDE